MKFRKFSRNISSPVDVNMQMNFPFSLYTEIKTISYFSYENVRLALKVLGKIVGFCKTTKRKGQLYINLFVCVWRIICENFNPNGLILAEI